MPIPIKDVKWTQTEDKVQIILKLSSNNPQPVDVFTSSKYLKVNSPPYIWESFLLHEIENDESSCHIFQGLVQFSLKKLENRHWDSLDIELDHHQKTKVREEAIHLKHESIQKKQKETFSYKEQKKREEIMNSTSRDAKTREAYQKTIKDVVQQELSSKGTSENVAVKTVNEKKTESPKKKSPQVKTVAIVPQVRKSTNIAVSFSDRNFITPKRESQEDEEQEWLLKQKEARKATGFIEEDLRPEERNPHWLKERGDTFYQQGNYFGAISAYSTAIRMTDQYWELFMNRAAAHFAVNNFQKCAEDSSKAYELLVPHCESNLEARKNCLARRGAALVKLGLIREGYDEIVAALKLKHDKVLERDAEMLRCKLEKGN